MLVGVPGVHGQHAPKPAVAEHRIVNGNVKVTARDMVTAQAQMKRLACVTHNHVLPVSNQICLLNIEKVYLIYILLSGIFLKAQLSFRQKKN